MCETVRMYFSSCASLALKRLHHSLLQGKKALFITSCYHRIYGEERQFAGPGELTLLQNMLLSEDSLKGWKL